VLQICRALALVGARRASNPSPQLQRSDIFVATPTNKFIKLPESDMIARAGRDPCREQDAPATSWTTRAFGVSFLNGPKFSATISGCAYLMVAFLCGLPGGAGRAKQPPLGPYGEPDAGGLCRRFLLRHKTTAGRHRLFLLYDGYARFTFSMRKAATALTDHPPA